MLPPVRTKWEILGTASDPSNGAICENLSVSLRESVKTLHENKKGAMGNENLRLPTILPEEEQIIDADQNLSKDIKT